MAAIPESLSALATTPIPETLSLPLSEPKLKTNVVQATESDVTALAELMSLSHGPELIMSIFFPDWPRTKTMVLFFEARLQASFAKEPGGKVFKAVTGNGEIVGCVAMMLRSGEKEGKGILGVNVDNVKGEDDDDGLEAVKERARNLKGANIDFLAHVVQGIEGLDNFVEGVKCYGRSICSHIHFPVCLLLSLILTCYPNHSAFPLKPNKIQDSPNSLSIQIIKARASARNS